MKKSILEIYALAVCFVTVVCFVIAFGIATYAAIGIANPEFTLDSWTYGQHQTNDAFWNGCAGARYCGPDDKKRARPSEAELSTQREDSYVRAIANERRNSSQTVVRSIIVILIDLVVFGLHWRIARSARASAA